MRIKLFTDFTDVFFWNYKSKKRFVVNQGGTNSSKTYAILQLAAIKCVNESNILFSVVATTSDSLKRGALNDFKNILKSSKALSSMIINPNLVKGPFRFKNGSILEFISISDSEIAKHGKREYLFLNEADSIDYSSVKQLIKRTTKQIYIDYNPTARFWVHSDILTNKKHDFFISTYKNNKFCPQTIIDDLLLVRKRWLDSGDDSLLAIYRKTKNKIDFENWDKTVNYAYKNDWYVYGLGLTGVTQGAIYKDVIWVNHLPLGLQKKAYVIDFGFANDPTAIILAGLKESPKIYGKELFYKRGVTTPTLIKVLRKLGVKYTDTIVADPSNLDAIAQLEDAGFKIIKAQKPAGSVKSGITSLLGCDIHLTKDSVNWKFEQENYMYKKIKGVWVNEPRKKHDHLWDCLRYYYQHTFKVFSKKRRKFTHRRKFILHN